MDVFHLRHVTGGGSKQTQCQSQGMFLLNQLSEMRKVAYGCLGASWALTQLHKSRSFTAGLHVLAESPRTVVALDLCSCAGANFQQSPGVVLLGTISAEGA